MMGYKEVAMVKPLDLVIPEEWEQRLLKDLGVKPSAVIAYAVYWSPAGDEMICCAVLSSGLWIEGDVYFGLMHELEAMNPQVRELPIGSSDEEPQAAILVDRISRKCYLVPMDLLHKPKALLETIGFSPCSKTATRR